MVKMKVKDPSVPPGIYTAEFDGTEPTNHDEYGPGLLWKWTVVKGRFRGQVTTRTTKPDPTPKNKCGVFLAGLVGKAPTDELEADPEDHEGDRHIVTVTAARNGGTKVESFVRDSANEGDGQPKARYAGQEPGDGDVPAGSDKDTDVPFDND